MDTITILSLYIYIYIYIYIYEHPEIQGSKFVYVAPQTN